MGVPPPCGAELPPGLVRVVSDNVASRREFLSMNGSSRSDLHRDLPPLAVVARLPPPARLLAYYRAAEARFGVGWAYLAAINFIETSMGRVRGTSVAGAQGPMQFLRGRSTVAATSTGPVTRSWPRLASSEPTASTVRAAEPGRCRYNNTASYVRGVTLVAKLLQDRPRAFLGYYHWKVYYLTRFGSILLPEGFDAKRRIPVRKWLAQHPEFRPTGRWFAGRIWSKVATPQPEEPDDRSHRHDRAHQRRRRCRPRRPARHPHPDGRASPRGAPPRARPGHRLPRRCAQADRTHHLDRARPATRAAFRTGGAARSTDDSPSWPRRGSPRTPGAG